MEIKTNGFKLPSGDIHVFIPPEPTETDRGGIKASEKTTESLEVKYDKKTGKLFSPASPTDNTLTESNVAADAKKTGDEFARVNNNMESKLDKQQGVENAGKAMVINPEGVIVPGEVTGGASPWKLVSTITLTQPTNDIVFRDNIGDYDSFFLIFEGSVSAEGSLRFNTGFNFGTGAFIVNNLVLKQNAIPGSAHKWWFNINKLEHSIFHALYQANENEGISAFIYKYEPNIQNFFVRALAGKPYATGSVFKLYGRKTA